MSLPIIKALSGPSPTILATHEAAADGMHSLSSAFSRAVDLVPHDENELRAFLSFRHAISMKALRRNRWFLGRLYNRFSGEDPDYVELSGVHLRQTLSVAGYGVPEGVLSSGMYKLRSDIVQKAIGALMAKSGL